MAKEGKSSRKKNKKLKQIFSEQLSLIKPTKQEFLFLKKNAEDLKGRIEKTAKKLKIKAECFIGGSLAKGTIIKKERYDLDIFARFEKNQKEKKRKKQQQEDISGLLERILKAARLKYEKIHGSRDYFIIRKNKRIFFEIVPVLKISSPKEAENTTDLSFFHVSYVFKAIKKIPKIADEIMTTKAFCHAQNCYGAESYIKGFSGYAIELLICHYKSFINFIRKIAELKPGEKLVIDQEKLYKNKQDILVNINEAKLQSPIILIDPTFEERNALAALSAETFEKFRKACAEFLKAPSKRFFEKQEIDISNLKKEAKRKKAQIIMLSCSTERQAGDIAGSKLLKFFDFIGRETEKYFDMLNKKFVYNQMKNANIYFILRKKKQRILPGPPASLQDNARKFRKEHKNCFVKSGRIYAKEKLNISFNQFFSRFKKENSKRIKEMGIKKCLKQ